MTEKTFLKKERKILTMLHHLKIIITLKTAKLPLLNKFIQLVYTHKPARTHYTRTPSQIKELFYDVPNPQILNNSCLDYEIPHILYIIFYSFISFIIIIILLESN